MNNNKMIPYSEMDIMFMNSNFFSYMFFYFILVFLNNELLFFLKMIKNNIKKEYMKYSMNKNFILFFFFMYILLMNIYGLFPFMFSYTSHFFITLNMSLFSYMMNIYFKCSKNIKNFLNPLLNEYLLYGMINFFVLFKFYFKCFYKLIMKALVMIVHIFTLSFRLTMNMTAGHLIMGVYSKSMFFLFFFIFYEIFASFMQSFIFFLMSNLYYN